MYLKLCGRGNLFLIILYCLCVCVRVWGPWGERWWSELKFPFKGEAVCVCVWLLKKNTHAVIYRLKSFCPHLDCLDFKKLQICFSQVCFLPDWTLFFVAVSLRHACPPQLTVTLLHVLSRVSILCIWTQWNVAIIHLWFNTTTVAWRTLTSQTTAFTLMLKYLPIWLFPVVSDPFLMSGWDRTVSGSGGRQCNHVLALMLITLLFCSG